MAIKENVLGGACSWQVHMEQPSPEEILELRVQEPDERAPSYDLSVAVVESQTLIADIFTIDALCPCGHADDLSLLHIRTCRRNQYRDQMLVLL